MSVTNETFEKVVVDIDLATEYIAFVEKLMKTDAATLAQVYRIGIQQTMSLFDATMFSTRTS